jgi:lipopolysaccharide export system permease protein
VIIHRAFVREVLQTCAAVTAILVSIVLVTRVVGFLRQAAEGIIPANSIFVLLMLKMITYLDILVPLVLYISTLLVTGRWIRDNELTVISACGIGMVQFLKPAMVLFLIIGCMVALFSLYLSPLSAEVSQSISRELRSRTEVSGVIPGVFTETRDGNGVYFVESYDKTTDTYRDIFVYDGSGVEEGVVVADVGFKTVDEKTNDDFLVLKNGTQYRGKAGATEYGVLDFETYALRVKQRAGGEYKLPLKAIPTQSLLAENHRAATGEFYWRFSKVLMLPVLMIFALAFSSITYRKSRFPGMLSALLVYFAYSNMLGLCVALIRRGIVSPHTALWVVHLVFLSFAIFLFLRRNQNKRLLPGLST